MTFYDAFMIFCLFLLLLGIALLIYQSALRFILTIHLRAIDLKNSVEKIDGEPLVKQIPHTQEQVPE